MHLPHAATPDGSGIGWGSITRVEKRRQGYGGIPCPRRWSESQNGNGQSNMVGCADLNPNRSEFNGRGVQDSFPHSRTRARQIAFPLNGWKVQEASHGVRRIPPAFGTGLLCIPVTLSIAGRRYGGQTSSDRIVVRYTIPFRAFMASG